MGLQKINAAAESSLRMGKTVCRNSREIKRRVKILIFTLA